MSKYSSFHRHLFPISYKVFPVFVSRTPLFHPEFLFPKEKHKISFVIFSKLVDQRLSKGQTKKTREAAGNRRKLTRAEKKQIAAVIRQAKGDGKAHTAQQTIPYLAMYPDGICKVAQRKYSKSIAFEDINYQLAQADDKTAIFENWCDFLNYFDASVNVQLSFINQGSQQEQAARAIHIPPQNDDFNSIRTEYSDMLKMQLAKGNNGLVKHKYITFSIEADNPAAARARLSRIETDVLNNFKVLGVSAHPLSGYERLKVLHGVFHPAGEPFSFSYDWLTPTGLTTKDFIAPSSFKFGEGRYFAMGKKTGAVSFLEILAPELNDRILADMLDLETGVIVNLHIKSIQDDCIRKNPFDFQLNTVLEDDTEPKEPLSPTQEAAFLSFVQHDKVYQKYYDEIIILLGTGLRISELCGLTEADIDLDKQLINVDHQLLKIADVGYYVETPKTKSGNRVIPMSEKVLEAFQRVLNKRKYVQPVILEGYTKFLFLNRNGLPKVAVNYESMFRGLVRKYNKTQKVALPKVMTPHTLRHTFCTTLANAGMNPKALQYIMGHSNINMTLNYYAHTTSETSITEMKRLIA